MTVSTTAASLYLVSPPQLPKDFQSGLAQALDVGLVRAFQLRLKGADEMAILKAAESLVPVCADRGVSFIVNDRADLALRAGADGVHLGQTDGSVAEARRLLGADAEIGVTCHASRHLAMEAGEAGANYVAFGSFFPSMTKPSEHRPEPAILGWWSALFVIPCVAIGGITPGNAAPLVAAGADFLAVSAAVWDHPKGAAAGVRAFADVLRTPRAAEPFASAAWMAD